MFDQLNRVVKKFKDMDVNFLAINLQDSKAEIIKFLNTSPFYFDQIADGGIIIHNSFFYNGSYPATFVIDQNLRIIKAFNGWSPDESIKNNIDKILIPLIKRALL
ncbi:MAG: redoxin domain-containing protein [Saprospiraceae bacterium]|uniref:Redoxin domain-containing protein n=1 Tax=Candidatus Opimibacter skivensis TaxID=2982028 RepID=A0A9D7XMK0_9BACT|nr:redoxin domain-containing protein [Candidatus Opimibacter skivensis]